MPSPQNLWLLAGILLVLGEFVAPGVIIVFFGAGAILTSITTWAGLTPDIGSQAAMFGIGSATLLFGLRRYVKKWFVGDSANLNGESDDDFTGREARVVGALPGRGGDGLLGQTSVEAGGADALAGGWGFHCIAPHRL